MEKSMSMDFNGLQDRIRGSVLGGAVGDALGFPVNGLRSYEKIQQRYGPRGITCLDTDHLWQMVGHQGGKAPVSDSTQLTLYTVWGMLYEPENGLTMLEVITYAYVEWYLEQSGWKNTRFERCWLRQVPGLNQRCTPDNTSLLALRTIFEGKDYVNRSNGHGAVTRVAPVPLYAVVTGKSIEEADRLAADVARITHHHPLGYLSAALEAHVIYRLVRDGWPTRTRLTSYVREGLDTLVRLFPDELKSVEYLSRLVERAVGLSASYRSNVEAVESLGRGETAEEVLAIAIYCALKYFGKGAEAMRAAVNHAGHSSATGSVTGHILGAAVGYRQLPRSIARKLAFHDLILHMADDLCRGRLTEYPDERRHP